MANAMDVHLMWRQGDFVRKQNLLRARYSLNQSILFRLLRRIFSPIPTTLPATDTYFNAMFSVSELEKELDLYYQDLVILLDYVQFELGHVIRFFPSTFSSPIKA